MNSVVPGALVSGLITAIQPAGLNLQVLGFFNGTIDEFHLPPGDVEENFKVGQKVKARVLYDISPSTPPRFALSLADHVVSLTSKSVDASESEHPTPLQEAFTIGTIVDPVKVIRVESERGLIAEVTPTIQGFVHVSQLPYTEHMCVVIKIWHRYLRSRMSTFRRCRPRPDPGKSEPYTERVSLVTTHSTVYCNSP